ncbi:auxin efflux carrier [Pantoea agglomerans]|uniref:Auxin efflux carrier n=1 Tax=Enterobacter agglomerans TaxID=549 RepID=A0A379ABP0_ENTAG|nr:auxin efflux carrier [Pantoea agglomerans]
MVLSALGVKMPDLVLAAIKPLGLAATAAALFLTGVILSARKLKLNAVVGVGTVTKLLIQPFIAWGLVLALGLSGPVAITAILMIALSAGFFGVVFGNRFWRAVAGCRGCAAAQLYSLYFVITAVHYADIRNVI